MAFLKNGEYMGAGPNHYSVGKYKEDGENYEMSVVVTQHGQLRTIFGKKFAGKLHVTSKGKIEKNISSSLSMKGFCSGQDAPFTSFRTSAGSNCRSGTLSSPGMAARKRPVR